MAVEESDSTIVLSDDDMSDLEIISVTLALEKQYEDGLSAATAYVVNDNRPGFCSKDPIFL